MNEADTRDVAYRRLRARIIWWYGGLGFGFLSMLLNLFVAPLVRAWLNHMAVYWAAVIRMAPEELIKGAVKGVLFGVIIWASYRRKIPNHFASHEERPQRPDEELDRWKHFDRVMGPLIGGITILGILFLAFWIGPCSSRW